MDAGTCLYGGLLVLFVVSPVMDVAGLISRWVRSWHEGGLGRRNKW